ncbi:hypothetical protein DM02DRAFT_627602 [Periconia macrospinosa]|uniref:F-box domain-containing protein n=1 Tax=Periconia macrospinosa TaxID=97972 RepID=A0A2V1DTF6_9PLEO|nr:hypothetical protein DM02DRAFT_627602 [Periconia macrospinosa]
MLNEHTSNGMSDYSLIPSSSTPGNKAKFETLPAELLLKIFGYLRVDDDKVNLRYEKEEAMANLARVSVVSHALHSPAQLVLYRSPYLAMCKVNIPKSPVQQFARTLLEAPSLFTKIQSLKIDITINVRGEDYFKDSQELMHKCKARLEEIGQGHPRDWYEKYLPDLTEAHFVAVIFALIPPVRTLAIDVLDIDGKIVRDLSCTAMLLLYWGLRLITTLDEGEMKWRGHEIPAFQKLHCLSFGSLDLSAGFAGIQSLRTVHIRGSPNRHDSFLQPLNANTDIRTRWLRRGWINTNVTKVKLCSSTRILDDSNDGLYAQAVMDHFLQQFPGTRHLEVTLLTIMCNSHGGFQNLLSRIRRIDSNLESLTIKTKGGCYLKDQHHSWLPHHFHAKSLTRFTKLKSLTAPQDFFFGRISTDEDIAALRFQEVLPKSLECLEMTQICSGWSGNLLDIWLRRLTSHLQNFPNSLRKIVLRISHQSNVTNFAGVDDRIRKRALETRGKSMADDHENEKPGNYLKTDWIDIANYYTGSRKLMRKCIARLNEIGQTPPDDWYKGTNLTINFQRAPAISRAMEVLYELRLTHIGKGGIESRAHEVPSFRGLENLQFGWFDLSPGFAGLQTLRTVHICATTYFSTTVILDKTLATLEYTLSYSIPGVMPTSGN